MTLSMRHATDECSKSIGIKGTSTSLLASGIYGIVKVS